MKIKLIILAIIVALGLSGYTIEKTGSKEVDALLEKYTLEELIEMQKICWKITYKQKYDEYELYEEKKQKAFTDIVIAREGKKFSDKDASIIEYILFEDALLGEILGISGLPYVTDEEASKIDDADFYVRLECARIYTAHDIKTLANKKQDK